MSARLELLRPEPTTIVLLVIATALLAGGLFFSVLLLPAAAIGLVAVVRKLPSRPKALLAAAWLFTILAGIGFVMLALSWGKLEYGITGYLVLWSPFIAALCAVVLFIASFHVR